MIVHLSKPGKRNSCQCNQRQ